MLIKELKDYLRRGPYAWPGGYPLYFLTTDGGVLSYKTVRAEFRNIISAMRDRRDDGWRVCGVGVNGEDTELYDDHTNEKIESAYGEDNE